jgi:hypothetical protein
MGKGELRSSRDLLSFINFALAVGSANTNVRLPGKPQSESMYQVREIKTVMDVNIKD